MAVSFSRRDSKEPLLFDQLDEIEIEDAKPPSRCIPWGKRFVSLVGLGGSIALRVASLYLWTNASASFGIGFTALSLVTCARAPETLARIRQVALPIIGQTSIFALSQAWANDSSRDDQIAFDNTITALLGANIQIALGWLFQQGAIRNESLPVEASTGRKLDDKPLIHRNLSDAIKLAGAIGLGTLSFLSTDTILQTLGGYFSTFLLTQVIGERVIDKIDDEIRKRDTGQGTYFRVGKTAFLTISYLGQILTYSILPWKQAEGTTKLLHLRIAGGLLGLFDGVLTRSQSRRVEHIPVDDLEELRKLPPPEGRWGNIACRIWKIAVPVISILGVIAFVSWQSGFVLNNTEPKIALGSMLVGSLGGSALCHFADWAWDPKKEHYFRDKLMSSIWYSYRILGIDPIFFYYGLINAVKMDGAAIASQSSPYRLTALFLAWFFYGGRMFHELFIGSSDRIGNAQIKYPQMAVFNAAMTTSYYVLGNN